MMTQKEGGRKDSLPILRCSYTVRRKKQGNLGKVMNHSILSASRISKPGPVQYRVDFLICQLVIVPVCTPLHYYSSAWSKVLKKCLQSLIEKFASLLWNSKARNIHNSLPLNFIKSHLNLLLTAISFCLQNIYMSSPFYSYIFTYYIPYRISV